MKGTVAEPEKTAFKLFDFFANCEYFETEFNYDAVLRLPRPSGDAHAREGVDEQTAYLGAYRHLGPDALAGIREERVGPEGMRIDRMFFDRFADAVRADETVVQAVEAGQWERVIDYVTREVFNQPAEYYTLEKLRRAADVDRRLTLREILEKALGLIPRFKSKDELLDEEFDKFLADQKLEDPDAILAVKTYFKAYSTSDQIRSIMDGGRYTALVTNPIFSLDDLRIVPEEYRAIVSDYVKDYVSLNQFV